MLNKYHIIVSSINIRYFFNFLFYTGKPAFPGRGILSSHFRFSIFFTIRVWAASICFTDGERDMQLFGSQTTIASLVLDLPSKFKKWTPISIFHTTPIVFFFWMTVVVPRHDFRKQEWIGKDCIRYPSILFISSRLICRKKVFQTGPIDNAGASIIYFRRGTLKKTYPKMVGKPQSIPLVANL